MHMVLILGFGSRLQGVFSCVYVCFSLLGVIAMLLLVYVLDPEPDLHNL